MNPVEQLRQQGQSVWLDFLRRALITSGELARMVQSSWDVLDAELQTLRLKLRDRLKVATTLGYAPRYLRSTGQIHKGGPNSGVFVQVIDEPDGDIPVPGRPYTFGQLKRAQADGNVLSLLRHKRRVTRVTLEQLREAVS